MDFEPIDISELVDGEEQAAVGRPARVAHSQESQTETPSMMEEVEGEETAPEFWNQDLRKPAHELKVERPEHRAICILAAQGFTTTEIAEQTGWTTATIQNVRKQPFAQKYIAHLMEKAGKKVVMSELQGAAKDAAELIIKSIRGEIEGQKPADRCKDAHKLLDRIYGTAPQVVRHEKGSAEDLTDEELAATIASGNM